VRWRSGVLFRFSEKMKIQEIQEFRIFNRSQKELRIIRFHRIDWGAFQNCFRMVAENQKGEINAKPCSEEFAQHILNDALQNLDPQDVEIMKFRPIDVSRPEVSDYF
jgi:hypothetical protein